MQAFDDLVATGVADQGDIQNGKGDYFNDVLALLLERAVLRKGFAYATRRARIVVQAPHA